MHEFSAAMAILDTVLQVAKDNNAKKIIKVVVELGELTYLNPEQVKFGFDVLSKGTIAEGAEIIFEIIPGKLKCFNCGYVGEINRDDTIDHSFISIQMLRCPKCGSSETDIIGGNDSIVKNIEIET